MQRLVDRGCVTKAGDFRGDVGTVDLALGSLCLDGGIIHWVTCLAQRFDQLDIALFLTDKGIGKKSGYLGIILPGNVTTQNVQLCTVVVSGKLRGGNGFDIFSFGGG